MDIAHFQFFFLILIRITSFMVASPVFSVRGIPSILKIGFSLLLSMIIFLTIPFPSTDFGNHIITFTLLIINEIIFGLAIGYMTNLIFLSIQMAGQYTDMQIGFSMAMMYDPTAQSSVSIFAKLYNWVGLALLFALDGHHYLIYSIAGSFDVIPIGAINISGLNIVNILELFSQSFATALKISIPIVVILFLTDIIMGLISRVVPQLNVFILSLPLKVVIGLAAMIVLGSSIVNMMVPVVESIPYIIDKSMKLFSL